MPNKRRRQLRQLYVKHNMRCCYCQRRVYMAESNGLTPNHKALATIEHVYSKLDLKRLLSNEAILACYECNHLRSQADYDAVFNNETYRDSQYSDWNTDLSLTNLLNNIP